MMKGTRLADSVISSSTQQRRLDLRPRFPRTLRGLLPQPGDLGAAGYDLAHNGALDIGWG